MYTCPMCKNSLQELDRQCPRCRTDLSLLTDYVDHLEDGLIRADDLTRSGHLGEAVWAYLEVLEVDPDQPTARRQVGQVAAAVRQFDRSAPGRRWLKRLRRQARFRQWLSTWDSESPAGRWLRRSLWIAAVLAALGVGFFGGFIYGHHHFRPPATTESATQ